MTRTGLFLWTLSSLGGFCISGQYRPICSFVYTARPSGARSAFMAWADVRFRERDHCRRVHLTWVVGRHLRGSDAERDPVEPAPEVLRVPDPS